MGNFPRKFGDALGIFFSRRERRRRAREDSGPGRRFARRVPRVNPYAQTPNMFTRTRVVDAAVALAPGLRRRDVAIFDDRTNGSVRVEVPAAHVRAVRLALADICPTGIMLDVCEPGSAQP